MGSTTATIAWKLGEINQSLINLTHLNYLDLSLNNFSGIKIPEFLGSFKNLKYLNLSSSGFVGNIPTHLGNLSCLEYLDLGILVPNEPIVSNSLATNNLDWLFGLSSLKTLDMSEISIGHSENWLNAINKLVSLSSLNLTLCNLGTTNPLSHVNSTTSLVWLNLEWNHLDSTIFLWLSNLTKLEHLSLAGNDINSDFPDMFEHLASLKAVDLRFNAFTGTITPFCKIHNLIDMNLEGNDFQDLISNCLGNLTSLISLRLADNQFEGSIPNSLSHLCRLQVLDLTDNNFSGQLPKRLYECRNLKNLLLSSNSFFGTIAESSLGNLSKLQLLDIDDNKFSGSVPLNLGELSNLESLDISSSGFVGSIPSHLGNLSSLEYLDLGINDFQGSIPSCLGNLTSLIYLQLFNNQFEGSIPNGLSHLCRLQVLDLSGNKLTDFTTVLSGCLLSSLKTLYLDDNNFSGQLPKRLFEYRNLELLSLSSNSFSGIIAESLGNLSMLQVLYIEDNKFSGSIPLNLGELSNLESLDISNNSFTGVLSEFHFSKLNKLDILRISGNLFVWNASSNWIPPFQLGYIEMDSIRMGPDFPHWLRTQRNVQFLSMRNANITNAIPDWFWDLFWNCRVIELSQNGISGNLAMKPHVGVESYMKASVEFLFLSNNQLTGEIPKWLCNLKDLYQLDLSTNKLHGEIPLCFEKLQNLIVLDLGNNNLCGHIPNSLGSLYLLESLHLRNNKLEEEVPSSLQNLGSLKVLDLSENELTDVIQPWIGEKLSNMRFLILHANHLYGDIPLQLCQLQHLQLLNLANNNMSGYIPHCFDNLTGMVTEDNLYDSYPGFLSVIYGDEIFEDIKGLRLQYNKTLPFLRSIDLSGNHLVGMIPMELTSLHALKNLNLSGNHLSGAIPASIGNLSNIESLDLSRNLLSDHIPPSLSSLNFLSYLNLSFNNLYGRIPSGNQLQTLNDPSIYIGNEGLCGAPLPKSCSPSPKASSVDQPTEISCDNHEFFMWFYAGLGPGFFVGFIGVLSILLFKTSWRFAYFKFLEIVYNNILHKICMRG
nr:receptor-like protein EIX2 [Ipomoea batatas]